MLDHCAEENPLWTEGTADYETPSMKRWGRKCLATLAIVLGLTGPSLSADLGVVLLPGKGGSNGPESLLGPVIAALKEAGIAVETPNVSWNKENYLAKDYEEAMLEIDQAVDRLRKQGAVRVVVGGQSMGANAALGYGARRDGIAGIMALSPGHVVDAKQLQTYFAEGLRRARQMVSAGKGEEPAAFTDVNQEIVNKVVMRARIYVSWFDPDGPAVFAKNAAALKPGTALLWLFGENDIMRSRGKPFAFAKAPDNPKNAYVMVPGEHLTAAANGADQIVAWVKGL
jgi:pimeloyl-ACP methyl ester carboxylesterase